MADTTSPTTDGRVMVCYLHPGEIAHSAHQSIMDLVLWDMQHDRRIVDGGAIIPSQCGSGRLEEGRNQLVATFLDNTECEWLFMFDADMGFAPDTVDRFLAVADPETAPVVGGLAFAQKLTGLGPCQAGRHRVDPTIYHWRDEGEDVGFVAMRNYPTNTLVECQGTGAACLFVHRTAAEKVRAEYGDRWFDRVTHPKGQRFSEDLSFCVRLAGVAVPLHVHTGIQTSHRKEVYLDEDWYARQQPDQLVTPRFVIAGTGRSGSGYISQVLRAAGVNCGHEEWWNPHDQRSLGLVGDSSWLAGPILEHFPGHVYHQMRHPLDVVSSIADGELDEQRAGPYYKVRVREFEVSGDNLLDSLRCYLAFFDMAAAHASREWKVEDVNVDVIVSIGKDIGIDISLADAQAALDAVPTDWNGHGDRKRLALGDLPDCPEKERLVEIAHRYGYEV